MVDCECNNICNWDTAQEIIQGDVNIESYQSANCASYICDVAQRRDTAGNLDTQPYGVQALTTWEHYAIMCYTNGMDAGDTVNRLVIIDLATQTVTDVADQFLPAGKHWNSATMYGHGPMGYTILFTSGYDQCTIAVSGAGKLVALLKRFSSDVSVGGISYDAGTGRLYGHSAGRVYDMVLSGNTFYCSLIFDGRPMINTLTNWLYGGYASHSQEIEYHDGVIYVLYSHPNTAFKFSTNGKFLGVDSIKYAANGHPLGEAENLAYSTYYNCFLLNSNGRVADDYEPNHHIWGRSYLFSWGGSAADNWPLEYSRNDGTPDNVQVGSTKIIYATANRPSAIPHINDRLRHDGTPANPFNFFVDALYMAQAMECDGARREAWIYASGNFAAYENGTYDIRPTTPTGTGVTVSGDLRITVMTDATVLPRLVIANSTSVDIVPAEGVTGGTVRWLNCSRNTSVCCYVNCPEVAVANGAKFNGNNLGTCKLSVDSGAIALLGGTNNTMAAGSSKHSNGLIFASTAVNNLANVDGIAAQSMYVCGVRHYGT